MRKIIRPGDWETLRRRARDAVYPDPPEPAVAALPEPEQPARPEQEPEPEPDEMSHMADAPAAVGVLHAMVLQAMGRRTFDPSRPAEPSRPTVFPGDARVFAPPPLDLASASSQAVIEAAADPAVLADLDERAEFLSQMLTICRSRDDALKALDDTASGDSRFSCMHQRSRLDDRPCPCYSFCWCRGHGCPVKRPVRFVQPSRLLRQWSKAFFAMPTIEVAARLALDRKLAVSTIAWARDKHAAWATRHGRSLVELEAHHGLINSNYAQKDRS